MKDQFLYMPGVDRIVPITRPFKFGIPGIQSSGFGIPLDGVDIGGKGIVIIAGPCAVENRGQLLETAHAVKEAGAHALRGGAYKPRTSPYSFQGLGEEGLKILAEAREETACRLSPK
jgi:3-deoxy-7-phosphoheptulonate synthase